MPRLAFVSKEMLLGMALLSSALSDTEQETCKHLHYEHFQFFSTAFSCLNLL